MYPSRLIPTPNTTLIIFAHFSAPPATVSHVANIKKACMIVVAPKTLLRSYPHTPNMDKRTFIKLFSAITAGPLISPMLAWAAGDKLKNWAGNIDYSTENLYSASSIEQVRSFVTQHPKLKALGTRHCFNKIADSSDYFLSLKSMDDVISLDPQARTV